MPSCPTGGALVACLGCAVKQYLVVVFPLGLLEGRLRLLDFPLNFPTITITNFRERENGGGDEGREGNEYVRTEGEVYMFEKHL